MKNLKIGKKLWITFILILVLLISMAVMAVSSLRGVGKNFETFYNSPFQVTNKTMDMRRALEATIKYVGYAVMTEDELQTAGYIAQGQRELDSMLEG